ncbi:MAG: chromophore lyase CpcT/CpeT [Cyanobacteria bacterium J06642_2]
MPASDLSRTVRLAQCLSGHLHNLQQAMDSPIWFANIHIYQCPLAWSVFNGVGLYIEQAYDLSLNRPYRQRALHFFEEEGQLRIQNYALHNPDSYTGAGRDLSMLKSLTATDIEILPGCLSGVEETDTGFRGESIGKGCRVVRKGRETYSFIQFEVTETKFQSLDRGLDPETDEMVWGSKMGPFQFDKKESFAHLVPTGPDWVAPELPKPEKKTVADTSDRVISI